MPRLRTARALLYRAVSTLSLIALLYYLVRELRRAHQRHTRLVRLLIGRRIISARELQKEVEKENDEEIFPWPGKQ